MSSSTNNRGDCMPKSQQSPFVLAKSTGDAHVTIFSGGACLEVANAHSMFQQAWNEFEESIVDAPACKMALRACFDLMQLADAGVRASFYTDGRVARAERVGA